MQIPVYEVTRDDLEGAVNEALSYTADFWSKGDKSIYEPVNQWVKTASRVLFGATIAKDGYICQCPIAGYQNRTKEFIFDKWESTFAYQYDKNMNDLMASRTPNRHDNLILLDEEEENNDEHDIGIAEIV